MLLKKFRGRLLRNMLIVLILMGGLTIAFAALLPGEGTFVILFLGGMTALLALIFLIRMLSTGNVRSYLEYTRGMPEEETTALYNAYLSGLRLKSAALTEHCLVDMGAQLTVLPYERILWVYPYVQTTRYAFIPISRSYFLNIVSDDKKTLSILHKKKDPNVNAFIAGIQEKNPSVLVGYDARTAEMMRSDFDGLVRWIRGQA